MKAYASCVMDFHPPAIGPSTGGCDFGTSTASSSTTISSHTCSNSWRRKRIRRPLLAGNRNATTSRLILSNPCRRNCCICSCSKDADYLEIGLEFGGNELPEPLIDSDSDSKEEEEDYGYGDINSDSELVTQTNEEDGIEIQIKKLGKRSRRIQSTISINASLSTIWDVLTDYERLADFVPGLVVSRLLEKRDNYARIFQIGQQNLALGLKFNAKAVLDCFEKELQILSFGQRRDIEFKMVEGDFETFEGNWSIEEFDGGSCEASQALDLLKDQQFHTILSYAVEVEPKFWLPVRLVESRLCREIQTNLACIRREAQNRSSSTSL